jgi:hypothetical protein
MCIERARLLIKRGNGKPTIPTSNDHTDGTWLTTDIYVGEQYLDLDTGVIYTRDADDDINQVSNGGLYGVFKAWLEFDEMIGMVVRQQVNTIGALTINQFTPAFGALELAFDISLSSYTSNVGIHIASVSQDPRIFGIANDGKFFIDGILLGDIKQTSVTIEIYETAQIITE